METMEYNGYANKETWSAVTHILNDQGLQYELISDLYCQNTDFESSYSIESNLKDWFTDYFYPSYWEEKFGMDMPKNVIKLLLDIGSLWRIEHRELVPLVRELAQQLLPEVKKELSYV